MSEVKVGMRLHPTIAGQLGGEITVTELTERGFKYRCDAPVVVHPRLGIVWAAEGHEHFGYNGEAFYEETPVRQAWQRAADLKAR